ncbi:MAG: choice-of-anchor D domain-containing protein [Chitinophagaceae bacterium]|nr:choice-of-anchor D domain-containing protein [Chitinophagaceae bacterium]
MQRLTKSQRFLLIVALLQLLTSTIFAQTFNPTKYTPDGPVYDLEQSGDTLIAAGAFDYVGKYNTGIAHVTALSDTLLPAPSTVNENAVWCTNDGSGGYYVIQLPSGTIRHILSNKQYDPNFSVPIFPGYLVSWSELRMLHHAGKLYLSGALTYWSFGNVANNIMVLDIASQQFQNPLPTINGAVSSIRIHNNKLYAIGSFNQVGGQSRNRIACFDLASNTLTNWYPQIDSCMLIPLNMTDIAFRNNQAIISGHFQNYCISGIEISKVGLFDLTTGNSTGYLFGDAGFFGGSFKSMYWAANIERITLEGDRLYLKSGGTYDTRITCYDFATDSVLWARFFYLTNTIREMKVIGNNIYCVGDLSEVYITDYLNYTTSGLERKLHNNVAFNKLTGVTENWDPFSNGSFTCLANEGDNIILTGYFSHINCIDRKALYAIKTSTNSILPLNINSHPNGNAFGLKVKDGLLYIAGNWYSPSFQPFSFSVYNLATGAELTNFTKSFGNAYCVDVSSNYIFVGGSFTDNTNNISKSNLLAINKTTGAIENWAPNPNSDVHRLLVSDGKLYVGGYFTNINGQSRERFAVYDANTLTLLSSPQLSFNGLVNSFKVDGGKIWVGGEFTAVNTTATSQLAAFSRTDGSLVRTTNLTGGMMSSVNDILAENDKLITTNVQVYYGFGDTCTSPLNFHITNSEAVKSNDFCVRIDADISKNLYCNTHIGNDLYFGGNYNKVNSTYQSPCLGRISMAPNYFNPIPTGPEIDVESNTVSIQNNNTTYQNANNTLLGAAPAGSFITKVYSIFNSGISNLSISGMTLSGVNAGNFAIISPFIGTIAPGEMAQFQVKFTSSGTGYKSASVSIQNNDVSENPFVINLKAYSGTAQLLNFDGVNDWVNSGINCDNSVMPNTTWEAWIKPTDSLNPNVQMVFSTDNFGWDRYLGISNNKFIMGLGYGNFEPTTVDWNQWQHVAVVYEGNSLRFYKNGVEFICPNVVDTASQNTNIPLQIGCSWHYVNDAFFKGHMDEIRIWDVAKQGSEIDLNKTCRITSAQPGLLANYTCDQGVPADDNSSLIQLSDMSGNSNHGILNGFMLNGVTSNFLLNNDITFSTNCLAPYEVKMLIQGYYNGGGTMVPLLYNSGLSNQTTMTDYVTVEFHQHVAPYALVYSTSAYVMNNGSISLFIPNSLIGGSKYIVVKHQNTLETWSKNPVNLTSAGTYNFTNAASKAHGDNMVEVESGKWAFFSGDINQDKTIDVFDYIVMDPDILAGNSGYIISDLNADGSVDVFDYLVIENNITNGISTSQP